MLGLIACLSPWIIDGDSLRCANLGEVRLLGIDAPDTRASRPCVGHFGDHVCDDAGARAAKASLIAVKRLGPIRLQPITRDRYGRLVAIAWAGGFISRLHPGQPLGAVNLSCWQLERGSARYIAAYDNGRRIARACRH